MNDNQILVIHSRGMYNFMGLIMWHSSLSLFCYHAFFSKNCFRFWHISPAMYILKPSVIGFALHVFRAQTGVFIQMCDTFLSHDLAAQHGTGVLCRPSRAKRSQLWPHAVETRDPSGMGSRPTRSGPGELAPNSSQRRWRTCSKSFCALFNKWMYHLRWIPYNRKY